MTFSPTFAFFRDDRPVDAAPPPAFWTAIRDEVAAELAQRQASYPPLVAKGRLSRTDADRELRVWRAIAEDWGAASRSPGFPLASWTEMVHALRREITLRRKFYPGRITAGRLDADTADRKLLLLEHWHDLLWHAGGREGHAARAATAAAVERAADPLPAAA